VLVVPFVGVALVIALALVALGGLVVGQRRAASAADLAALAGASALQRGDGGCDAARRTADSNGARLVECGPSGEDLLVRVVVDVDLLRLRTVAVPARARAGPVHDEGLPPWLPAG
jgi:secretion/DNA translocation related TadE-like protein